LQKPLKIAITLAHIRFHQPIARDKKEDGDTRTSYMIKYIVMQSWKIELI
jgi:hypothetical protein